MTPTTSKLLVGLLVLGAAAGCRRPAPQPPDAAEPLEPPSLTFTKDRKDLLFTYVDAEGKLRDVDDASKVPEDRRKQVLVRDLSRRAEEVKADQYVYVADLTREVAGAWPHAVVSRYGIDRSIRDGDFVAVDEGDAGPAPGVVVYGTSWCGACGQARSWLRSRGVAFADKDVEKDERANAEMQRKLKRANIPFGGVPVIDVGGQLMLGFDPSRLEALLKGT